jgi:hypothetical protein
VYGEHKAAVVAAHFGLAAIYENAGQWDKAKQKYHQIIDDAGVAEAYKTQARIRLEKASDWSQPVLLVAAATQPATAPSTQQALTQTTTATLSSTTLPTTTQPVER